VLDESRHVRPTLTAAEAGGLIAGGIATGGMQAKLEAAMAALRQGVGRVRIAPGALHDVLLRVLEGDAIGTELLLNEVPA